ncbi:hypothetical protein [Nostocoides sp.]
MTWHDGDAVHRQRRRLHHRLVRQQLNRRRTGATTPRSTRASCPSGAPSRAPRTSPARSAPTAPSPPAPASVAGVEVIDDNTVKLTLDAPNSTFLAGLSDMANVILPAAHPQGRRPRRTSRPCRSPSAPPA